MLSSNGAFPKISSASVAQRSYLGCGAQELLERHYEALAALGWGGEVVPTAEARVEATYLYYQTPEVRSVLRRTGLVLLVAVALLGWLLVR